MMRKAKQITTMFDIILTHFSLTLLKIKSLC